MEKDKSQSLGVNFLPPSGRNLGSLPYGNNENPNSEPLGSTTIPPIRAGIATESVHFSHDISRMPDNPPRHLGHRRAHSEIVTLPDDLNFDSDLGVLGVFDGPSYSDDTEEDLFSAYLDMYRFNSASATSASQLGESSSSAAPSATAATPLPENHVHSSGERPRIKHQHSVSMDGSSTINPEMLTSGPAESSSTVPKKSMPADKLAELALVDPKRAKRMWANRQSAARSKERKIRYIAELERKVHALQIEATSLSAQLTLLQSDTNGLTVENSELKLRLQTMEQQVHLQDALNDALKEEIQHLKVVAGQNLMNGGSIMNFRPSLGPNQQFHPNNNQTMRTQLTAHQFQQLQIQRPFQPQQLHQFHNSSEFNPHAPRD